MNSKFLKEEIAIRFSGFMESYGYIREKKAFRWIKHPPFGWDDLRIRFIYKKTEYTMELEACRRFEAVESILGPFFQMPNYYRNDGTDVTLAFCANKVDKINYIARGYNFTASDYEQSLIQMQSDFSVKIYPILEETNSLEKLNNFINNPPNTFEEKVYFFPLDGGTLFRKMILAKLVNNHYDEVCSFVFNRLSDGIASRQLNMETYDYLQIYQDVKRYLDQHFN